MTPARKIKIVAAINDIILGGAQAILLNIASLLDKERFSIGVCYINDYGQSHPNFQAEFEAIGIHPVNLGKGKVRRLFASFVRLYLFLRKEKPDILQCYLPDSVILAVFAGRLAGVRKIVIHEMNTHRFYSQKLEFFFSLARKFVDLTICFSEPLEVELFGDSKLLQEPLTRLDRKSYTIYSGIDIGKVNAVRGSVSPEQKREELGLPADAIVAFSAARLIEWKGFEYLVRAMPKVAKACPSVVLLIAGEGEQEPFLRGLIDELGVAHAVRLLGPRTDVYELLCISDLYPQAYVFPPGLVSVSISMSGLEAMAFEVPVIASRYRALFAGIEDGRNAMIVEPANPNDLADAIISLTEDAQTRTRIGKEGRAFVESYFSSDKIVRLYESVYEALMAPRKAS